jgi:flagellar biogenesis protein FliO
MFRFLNKAPISDSGCRGIAGFAAFLRRMIPAFGRRSAVGGALEHLGSLPLTAQSSLALVRLHEETLLLGITPQGITLLTKGVPETRIAPRVNTRKSAARNRRGPEEAVGR